MLYVFHGPDEFSRGEAVAALLGEVLPAEFAVLNTTRLDGSRVTLEELRFACGTAPFLAPHRVVMVEGLLARAAKDRELALRLATYLTELPPYAHLLLIDAEAPPASGPLAAALRAAGAQTRAFALPTGRELARWVQTRAQREGGSFLPGAADLLISYAGGETRHLAQEIRKLVAYVAGERSIDERDVRLLVSGSLQADIWRFVDAVGRGQVKQALEQVHALLLSGRPPEYVLSMVARQVRLLLHAKSLVLERTPSSQIASALGLRNFALQRTLEQARPLSLGRLEAMHRRVLAADVQIKTGALEPELALDLLVVELCGSDRRIRD
jgi:DNA polymerase-3 subunit delta